MAKTSAAASANKKTPAMSESMANGAGGRGGDLASSQSKHPQSQHDQHKEKSSKTPGNQCGSKDEDSIVPFSETALFNDDTKIFYSSIECIPRRDKFMKSDPLSQPMFNQTNDKNVTLTWHVSIGDLVCIESSPAGTSSPPFTVQWRPCQILSLFREKKNHVVAEESSELSSSTNKERRPPSFVGPLKMEVRWFYRSAELDTRNRRHERSLRNKSKAYKMKTIGELFESGHVSVVDASLLLGRLDCIDNITMEGYPQRNSPAPLDYQVPRNYPVPTVACLCRRYYLHEEKDIIEIYNREERKFLARMGLECSELLLEHGEGARNAAYSYLGVTPPPESDLVDAGSDGKDEPAASVTLPPPIMTLNGKVKYYASCTLSYPLSQLTPTYANLLCPPSKRNDFPKWELCVGDVVAVRCGEGSGAEPAADADAVEGRDEWYPYPVPWHHGQVTAICRANDADHSSEDGLPSMTVDASSVQCEIRWFPRVTEAQSLCEDTTMLQRLKGISQDKKRTSEVILEGIQLCNINCGYLLGPVLIDDEVNFCDDSRDYQSSVPSSEFFVKLRRTVSGAISCSMEGVPLFGGGVRTLNPSQRVQRAIRESKQFNENPDAKKTILAAVLQRREERSCEQIRNMTELLPEDTDFAETTGTTDDTAGVAGVETSVDFEGSPHRKRRLFGEGDLDGENTESKKPRSARKKDSGESSPQDTAKLEAQGKKRTQNSGKKRKQSAETTVAYETRATCCVDPFHVDVSARKSFYEEIEIIPPVDSYDKHFSSGGETATEKGKEQWRVKMGDTVAIEMEQTKKESSSVDQFPFAVPWALAEIVSIYRRHKSRESCARLRELLLKKDGNEKSVASSTQEMNAGDILMEVRWFYRPHEIPGASKKRKESDGELEEVFESDQIDVCSPDTILSPIRIHDVIKPSESLPGIIAGMPCIHYHCSRLWSVHRRSFVPSGSLSNRVSRGRMYSAYPAAFNELQKRASSKSEHAAPSRKTATSWKEAFEMVIQKLSLAEAAQDAHENGMVLTCREKERHQITTFLRNAIRGGAIIERAGDEGAIQNTGSSLFIAGPPGTGKTASVRSIISELQKEQFSGLLPEFNFIALNGMELRHPFDAYINFWEAVSGPRKEKLSAEEAIHELEHYFCGDQGDKENDSDSDSHSDSKEEEECEKHEAQGDDDVSERPVTVLMLDEVDYFLTRKQTLIYNFFDWPLRATRARLVVIGISNTLNLPERLSGKIQSRIGGGRCHFKAYNAQDTITILNTKIGMTGENSGYPVFEADAIDFAAKKTANLSGDIRKAFHICKAAAESVLQDYSSGKRQLEEGSQPIVKISDVQKGSRDQLTTILLKAVSCSTDYEALVLISLGSLKRGRGEEGSFEIKEILTKIESIANASGDPKYMNARLSFEDLRGMLSRLGNAGIIQQKTYSSSPWPWNSTVLHTLDILAAYRDTRHSKLAEKHLAPQRLF